MPVETQRAAILRVLSEREDWVSRQELIEAIGYQKGYAAIIGASTGDPADKTLRQLGWVVAKKEAGNALYRITPEGKNQVHKQVLPLATSTALTNWQKALQALAALGGKATLAAIYKWLVEKYGAFDMENLRKDLIMLSVNDKARFAYRAWEVRHGNPKVSLDHVFAGVEKGPQRTYEVFDPNIHGEWEAYQTASGALNLRVRSMPTNEELRSAQLSVPEFDPADAITGKTRTLREIAVRQGAPAFRKKVMQAFARTCCVTGCEVEEILEAAHIRPYDGPNTNHVTNGLLLRSDIHTLFDLGLIRIATKSMAVVVHSSVLKHAEYEKYNGLVLPLSYPPPSAKALDDHWKRHEAKWAV